MRMHGWINRKIVSKSLDVSKMAKSEERKREAVENEGKKIEEQELFEKVTPLFSQRALERNVKG